MSRILIIDDDAQVCETIESLVTRLSHEADYAHTLSGGLERLKDNSYDVVFLDVRLPDGNGLDVLNKVLNTAGEPEVIILTGKGDPDGAELAIQGGAWDYLLKPSSIKEMSLALSRALKYREQKLSRTKSSALNLDSIVGESQAMQNCFRQTAQAATSNANVLITGETGTGKGLLARTIHDNSARAKKEFVVVDCASLTETLVESTLFGHRKGAFTGAQSDRIGLVKLADGGTLFLDEVGEMPLSIQKAFLRVLQEHTFRPVGDTRELSSEFRLVSATNRDLEAMVERGEFRSDLLFRLKSMEIHLPPLRERVEDLRSLASFYVNKHQEQIDGHEIAIGTDCTAVLEKYDWPGNVRELFNMLDRAMAACGEEKTLYAMHLPRDLRVKVAREQVKKLTGGEFEESPSRPESVRKIGQDIFEDIFEQDLPKLREFKSMAEKIYLAELIRQGDGDIPAILKISGLSRSHFYALLKKHEISL